jgi:hypothetical protein
LPDGIFSNQKSLFGKILEGPGMEKVSIFYGHLKYIMAFLYILWAFGNLVTIWYVTPSVLVYCVKKSGNPAYMRVFAQQQQQQQCMLTSGK